MVNKDGTVKVVDFGIARVLEASRTQTGMLLGTFAYMSPEQYHSERATTIGGNKLYVAFRFQYFNFNSIDGQNTSNIPAVLKHQSFPPFGPTFPSFLQSCPNQTGMTGSYAGNPCFVRDVIETTNNIDLSVHQYTIYATYGITPSRRGGCNSTLKS